MTALAGYAGAVKLGSGPQNQVLEIDKWDLTIDGDIYDVSSFSNVWKAQIPGMRKWSGTFSGRLYQGDVTGQAVIQTALLTGASVILNLWIDGTHSYTGTAYIKQLQIKQAVNATVDVACAFEGTSSVTYS